MILLQIQLQEVDFMVPRYTRDVQAVAPTSYLRALLI